MPPATTAFFTLLPLILTIAAAVAAPVNFPQLSCNTDTSNLFASNSTYASNLDSLLSSLSANLTASSSGFANSTSGSTPSTTVYGLALCRGDVSADVCTACFSLAVRNLRANCSGTKEAIVWQEWCMLRYANRNIFSSMEVDPAFPFHSEKSVTGAAWLQVLTSTVNNVTERAAAAKGGKKFATNEAAYTALHTLYSLAQCTPDLTDADCSKCLRVAIGNLPVQNQGGIVLLPSCSLRYDLDKFYANSTVPELPPAPAANTGGATAGKGEGSKSAVVIVAVAVSVVLLVLIGICICILYRRAKKKELPVSETGVLESDRGGAGIDFPTAESLHFDFVTLQYATQNFSNRNKIGEGGFGAVYKGVLVNGREVAVKRLSRVSDQGEEEFKNEAKLLAKLQHRNLVRLLGFCLAGEERLLVYEFVTNHSLNYFLFDPRKQGQLDWPTRFKIIGGIARGMLYLHEYSRLKIIHRDLKTSNILLDEAMNPKIADFGMARIFGADQTQDKTKNLAGTHGYMAPEYVTKGQYSTKSDVYSFGILVLEIITGQKNSSFHLTGLAEDLPSYAWENWAEGTPLLIMDSTLKDISTLSSNEAKRCIHIGLLCIQKDVDKRPTMAAIVHMLNSSSFDTLPDPQQLDFCVPRMPNSGPGESVGSDQSRTK